MIRIALCDDEQKILDEVSQHIQRYAQKRNDQRLEVVCFDSAAALSYVLDADHPFLISATASPDAAFGENLISQ